MALYRIASEALHHVVRPARGGHAHAAVVPTPEAVTVEVRDDGAGVPGGGGRGARGVGLRSMAERAEELGGTFALVASGTGTAVGAVLPRTAGT
ncbi:ATP-binding protein [Streptomyces sp. NPDC096136]|uniref:ATP-binding protein n=1 Tax=Streptomyces sp. NPDC096136 TaxID=3366076 RepID=UPI0038290A2F